MNLAQLFSFTGRIGRLEYWVTHFSLAFACALLLPLQWLGAVGAVLSFLCSLAIGWVSWAITAKRLHDTGRSLWWFVGYLATGFAGAVAVVLTLGDALSAAQYGRDAPNALSVLWLLAILGYLVWAGIGLWVLGLKRSEDASNRFGSPHSGTALFPEFVVVSRGAHQHVPASSVADR